MQSVPRLLHFVNITALLLGAVLLLTAVHRTAQLMILVPVLILLAIYWRLRARPAVVAWYFGMAMALLIWILLCENIVRIDKTLGTRISGTLRLGPRLSTYVWRTLPKADYREIEPCCNDALTWHYRPGSRYRAIFDCRPAPMTTPDCYPPYETTVDETGYLNPRHCPPQCYSQTNMFIAGDSVLAGLGVPSVIEHVRGQIPLQLWNLSTQGYGPRQKVNALLTFAVPNNPRWLVIEFYGLNDLFEGIQDDVCQHGGDFTCRYNAPAIERGLAQHPPYATIFNVSNDFWARMSVYVTDNLTLAMTSYVLDAMKGGVKSTVRWIGESRSPHNIMPSASPPPPNRPSPRAHNAPASVTQVTIAPPSIAPGGIWVPVREGQWPALVQAGLTVTLQEYERLAAALARRTQPPEVILLYNPAPYEVYRLLGMKLDERGDQLYPVQQKALRTFASKHGWHFLDLTEPLRSVVRRNNVWLYGEYDQSHWSPQGTAIVGEVLAAELLVILGRDSS